MYLFATIVIVIVAVFGIIFGAQNSHLIGWNFLGKHFTSPLISVMVIAFVCGVVLAFVLAIIDELRLRSKIGKQQREIESLKRELGTLKTMPTEEEKG